MGSKDAPDAPKPVDPGKAQGEYLFGKGFGDYQGVTDPALQNRLISSEREFRPQYAGLNLQDLSSYLFGVGDQAGVVDLTNRATAESETSRADIASRQRESDISDVEGLGGRATEAFRASDPYTKELIGRQREMTNLLYDRAEGLTPEQKRNSDQQAREAFGARGRLNDNSSVAAEILGREDAMRNNRNEARDAGSQSLAMYQATAADPFQAILGRPAQAMNYGASLGAQSQGLLGSSTPQLFNPDTGINLALQNNANQANYQSNVYGAQQAQSGSMWGGLLGGAGSAIGGLFG